MKQNSALSENITIDNDQKQILFVFGLYSDEANNTYLQYTAA